MRSGQVCTAALGVCLAASAAGAQDSPTFIAGTYYECDVASWNWMRHVAGGEYRRILVIDAADHTSVLEYWNALTDALDEAQPTLAQRFTDICDSHSDFVWDIGVE